MTSSVPRPASTVVLVRAAPAGLEIFLVRRHDSVAFMGGAHVFPGGRVDPGDRLDDPAAICDGVAHVTAQLPGRDAADAVAFGVAAVRELFEEAGVLLARRPSGPIIALGAEADAATRADRRALADGTLTLPALAARDRIRLALDHLACFAHWVTPDVETKRFDTHFFLAVAPDQQEAAHDEGETSHGLWIAPADALARCHEGGIALPPPTWTTLRWLAGMSGVQEAWRAAVDAPAPRVMPAVRREPDGTRLILLPGDPEHQPAMPGFTPAVTRFVLEGSRWRPVV